MDRVLRDRVVMEALLAMEDGDQSGADQRLEELVRNATWSDWEDPGLGALLVRAARIHLALDLETEMELIGMSEDREQIYDLKRFLPSSDVVHPLLARRIGGEPGGYEGLESLSLGPQLWPIEIPVSPSELNSFRNELDTARKSGLSDPSAFFLSLAEESIDSTLIERDWQAREPGMDDTSARSRGLKLAELGWKKWRIVASSLFLAEAAERLLRPRTTIPDRLNLALLGTLSLFREAEAGLIRIHYRGSPLGEVIDKTLYQIQDIFSLNPTLGQLRFTIKFLQPLAHVDPYIGKLIITLEEIAGQRVPDQSESDPIVVPLYLIRDLGRSGASGICLFLLSPSPLEALAERVIGLPAGKSFGDSKMLY